MRLYKTELYKLISRKIFPAGILCITAFILLYFFQNLSVERSTINGVTYHGYEAVRADRQITEAFRGTLTDEKLRQIVDRYGFPQKVEPYVGLADSNFLNKFVMRYCSDGYINSWDDYRIATRALPLAETELGQCLGAPDAASGSGIRLEYYAGWESFTSIYEMEMILISVFLLCIVSPSFSNETQQRMKPLLFTTQEGPARDVSAKLGAAFTVSVLLWLAFSLLSLLLYGMVYGWDGLYCAACLPQGFMSFKVMRLPFGIYLLTVLLLALLATLELCAIILYVSAHCRSNFHAVAAAALGWASPMLAAMVLLRGIYQVISSLALSHRLPHDLLFGLSRVLFLFHCLVYSAPFFLIREDMLIEISVIDHRSELGPLCIVVACACAVPILCMIKACRRYRKELTR